MKHDRLIVFTIVVVLAFVGAVVLLSPLSFGVFLFGSPVVAFFWGRATAGHHIQIVQARSDRQAEAQ